MKKIFCLLFALAFFAACGDNGTNADKPSQGKVSAADYRVESMKKLPECVDSLDGKMVFVEETYTTYKCEYLRYELTGMDGRKNEFYGYDWQVVLYATVETFEDLSICGSVSIAKVLSENALYHCYNDEWEKYMDLPNASDFSLLTDSRDGQVYKTVKSRGVEIMTENLKFEMENSFCYNDLIENCAVYGRLYTWNAAKMACPAGWMLPSRHSTDLWWLLGGHCEDVSCSGLWWVDDFAFVKQAVGYRRADGSYISDMNGDRLWSSDESVVSETAALWNWGFHDGRVSLDWVDKEGGYPIRCIRFVENLSY